MPSYYTEIIKERDVTFREFALKCSRAIDYLIIMRNEPLDAEIPTKFLPSKYFPRKLKKFGVKLKDAEAMQPEEAERRAKEEYEREFREYTRVIEDKRESEKKCRSLLEKLRMWQPPTPDHESLKDFMKNQLEDFMRSDCSTDYYEKPKEQTGVEYKANLIRVLNQKIKSYSEEYEREIANARRSTEWVKELCESLPEDGK